MRLKYNHKKTFQRKGYNFVMVKLITDSGEYSLEFRNQLEGDRSQITFDLEIC